MPAELIVAIVLLIALVIYAIFGGTDYGIGVWVLFSHGKRGMLQRDVISRHNKSHMGSKPRLADPN